MLTVKEFRDLGVVFVKGDRCGDNTGSVAYAEKWYMHGNIDGDSFDQCKVTYLAWRQLDTLPDNPKLKYEQDFSKAEIKWRPLLDQSDSKVGEPAKPVFTQEMADMQYELGLHKANSELLATLTNFMVKNNIGKIGESCIDVAIRELSEKHKIDTRTPKQKAIDEIVKMLRSDGIVAFDPIMLHIMYEKGFIKQ